MRVDLPSPRVASVRTKVVAILVVLVVLVGGGLLVDRSARGQAEARLAAEVRAQLGLAEDPDVTITGFPFLTQVAAGELQEVRIGAREARLDGLPLTDAQVVLRGVSTSAPTTIRAAAMTASVALPAIQELVEVEAALEIVEGRLLARTTVLMLPVAVSLVPRPDGRAIAVDVESILLAGLEVDASRLPAALTAQISGIRIPVEGLPAGMELTSVTVTPGGVDVAAAGTDVVLEISQGANR